MQGVALSPFHHVSVEEGGILEIHDSHELYVHLHRVFREPALHIEIELQIARVHKKHRGGLDLVEPQNDLDRAGEVVAA